MLAFEWVAEQRIREAMQNGAFDHLRGAGKALELDNDRLVPAEVRAVYRVLKNAGYVPPEIEAHREVREVRRLLQRSDPASAAYAAALRKLQYLSMRLSETRAQALQAQTRYTHKLLKRLGAM